MTPRARQLPDTVVFGFQQRHAVKPRPDVDRPTVAEVEQHGPRPVQQREDALHSGRRRHVEIRHAPSDERVRRTEIVVNAEARHLRREILPWLVHEQQLTDALAQRGRAFVRSMQGHLRHGLTQHACGNGMTFGMIRVEQRIPRDAMHDLRELPAEVHGILHAEAQSLSADGRVHVGCIAGEQHASLAIRLRLSRGIREARDPRGTVNAVVGATHGDERPLHVVQRRFA